jgi:hypothetical protein
MGELMAVKKRKMAAALAAVGLYLQQEEVLAQEQQDVQQAREQFSPWAHSGRQDIMAMRRLIQMRAFTRF